MKLFVKLLAITGTLALASCSKEYKPIEGEETNTLRGKITATLSDGTTFNSDQQTARKIYNENSATTSLAISGIQYSYEKDPKFYDNLALSIGVYEGPKTYKIEYSNSAMFTHIWNTETVIYNAKQFEENSYIQVDSDSDGKISGTFYFVAVKQGSGNTEEITVSNGEFEAYE